MKAEDVDVFVGFGEGISSDERPDLISGSNEDWFYGG